MSAFRRLFQPPGLHELGKRGETFGTKREAVEAAVRRAKRSPAGQVVVHGKDGRMVDHRTYGMPRVQEPPRESSLGSGRIAKAVGKVVLERLRSVSSTVLSTPATGLCSTRSFSRPTILASSPAARWRRTTAGMCALRRSSG
ncbi:MAG: DUF2188 domain-containing protein [Acidobacteria bacterium]|nr:DUF2188 domain-containing protein [Acidobacteriota bacterium]